MGGRTGRWGLTNDLAITGYFKWYADHIQELRASGKVNVNIHVTGNTPPPSADEDKPNLYLATPPRSTTPIELDREVRGDVEKMDSIEKMESQSSSPAHSEHIPVCSGNCGAHQLCLDTGIDISEGRPSVSQIIKDEVARAGRTERILIIGCGPVSLMDEVRNTTAACIQCEGPALELHCEQFGW